MARFKPIAALFMMIGLAGCIASDNPLPLSTVTSFKLADVAVTFPPEARLNYPRAEDEFAASKGVAANDISRVEALAESPEGVAFVRASATASMRDAFTREVGATLHGTHPIRVEVAVTQIDVPGIARSILLDGTARLQARVSLVDAASGQVLFTLPDQGEAVGRGGGIIGTAVQTAMESSSTVSEPYQALCAKLARDYAEWLFKERRAAS